MRRRNDQSFSPLEQSLYARVSFMSSTISLFSHVAYFLPYSSIHIYFCTPAPSRKRYNIRLSLFHDIS